MPHDVRVRIFTGISLVIGGLALAWAVPVAIALIWMPDLSPSTISSEISNSMMRLQEVGEWGTKAAIVGWTIAAAAFGYTYYVWARWFVGDKPQTAARLDA